MTGDAKQVLGILAWAQGAGLQLAQVTVGACHVELHRTGGAPAQEQAPAARESIYSQFGGPALHDAVGEIPASELQPAIGRSR